MQHNTEVSRDNPAEALKTLNALLKNKASIDDFKEPFALLKNNNLANHQASLLLKAICLLQNELKNNPKSEEDIKKITAIIQFLCENTNYDKLINELKKAKILEEKQKLHDNLSNSNAFHEYILNNQQKIFSLIDILEDLEVVVVPRTSQNNNPNVQISSSQKQNETFGKDTQENNLDIVEGDINELLDEDLKTALKNLKIEKTIKSEENQVIESNTTCNIQNETAQNPLNSEQSQITNDTANAAEVQISSHPVQEQIEGSLDQNEIFANDNNTQEDNSNIITGDLSELLDEHPEIVPEDSKTETIEKVEKKPEGNFEENKISADANVTDEKPRINLPVKKAPKKSYSERDKVRIAGHSLTTTFIIAGLVACIATGFSPFVIAGSLILCTSIFVTTELLADSAPKKTMRARTSETNVGSSTEQSKTQNSKIKEEPKETKTSTNVKTRDEKPSINLSVKKAPKKSASERDKIKTVGRGLTGTLAIAGLVACIATGFSPFVVAGSIILCAGIFVTTELLADSAPKKTLRANMPSASKKAIVQSKPQINTFEKLCNNIKAIIPVQENVQQSNIDTLINEGKNNYAALAEIIVHFLANPNSNTAIQLNTFLKSNQDQNLVVAINSHMNQTNSTTLQNPSTLIPSTYQIPQHVM